MHNTEDKQWWVKMWRQKEDEFVTNICPRLGLKASINPEKQHNDYAIDLIVEGQIADLKCQTTPFFSSSRYKCDPQFTITFNRKDYERYSRLYPNAIIYFWVDWQLLEKALGGRIYSVLSMSGVWRVPFLNMKEQIESGAIPLHPYQRRQSDRQGNAKDSFLFDLRSFECLEQIGPLYL